MSTPGTFRKLNAKWADQPLCGPARRRKVWGCQETELPEVEEPEEPEVEAPEVEEPDAGQSTAGALSAESRLINRGSPSGGPLDIPDLSGRNLSKGYRAAPLSPRDDTNAASPS